MFRSWMTACLLAVTSGVGLALVGTAAYRTLQTPIRQVDSAVAVALELVGSALLAWYLITAIGTMACLAVRRAGHTWSTSERWLRRHGAPLTRRLLATGGGAAMAAAAVLAPAAAAVDDHTGTIPTEVGDDLGWGAVDPEPDGAATSPPEPAPQPDGGQDPTPAAAPEPTSPEQYTVTSGDSLWSIAAEHLPDGAEAAAIAASWPTWFEVNRSVIGDDPHLIHPGQVLQVPDDTPQEEA